MTLRPWLVRRSAWPFSALGAPLGVVQARTLDHAHRLAALEFPRPFTVEPASGATRESEQNKTSNSYQNETGRTKTAENRPEPASASRASTEHTITPRRPFTPHHFRRRIRRSEDA